MPSCLRRRVTSTSVNIFQYVYVLQILVCEFPLLLEHYISTLYLCYLLLIRLNSNMNWHWWTQNDTEICPCSDLWRNNPHSNPICSHDLSKLLQGDKKWICPFGWDSHMSHVTVANYVTSYSNKSGKSFSWFTAVKRGSCFFFSLGQGAQAEAKSAFSSL